MTKPRKYTLAARVLRGLYSAKLEPITKSGPRITRIDAKKIPTEKIIRVNSRHWRANLFFSYFYEFAFCAVAARRRVIFSSLILTLIGQTSSIAMAQTESPNLIGAWNVAITFADSVRKLRFEAQDSGKGSFVLQDPAAKAWGSMQPSEAKWTRGNDGAVTFSGPMEFPLGNVGRDAGTLMFKGKFETPDLITGEVEFSTSVGERPSKHGTFKAKRAMGAD